MLDAQGSLLAANRLFDRRLLAEPRAFRTMAATVLSPIDVRTILDGEQYVFSVSWSACLWNGAPARLVRLLDVSLEREDILSLSQSVQTLEEIIDALPATMLIVDESGRIVSGNARWHISARANGLALPNTGIGANYLEVCDRAAARGNSDADVVARGLRDVLERRLLAFETEYKLEQEDGSIGQWYRLAISALEGQRGAVIQHTETTESHREQQARIDALAHFKAVFEGAIDTIVIFDDALTILSANAAATQLFGRRNEALTGTSLADLLHHDDVDRFRAQHRELMSQGVARSLVRLRHPDGSMLHVEYVARAHVVSGRHVAVLRDMTSARELEIQLRQAQKMEALGQLTGGIAHDFNNILTIVVAHADLVLNHSASATREVVDGVSEILRAAQRGADMVRKLMAFSRQEQLRVAPAHLEAVIADMAGILRRILPESIIVVADAADDIPPALIDATAVQQILLNLATNARDAMAEQGGSLHLHVSVAPGEARDSGNEVREHGNSARHVVVSISDSGTGMSADTMAHLFEPFFTTKKQGEGTGLGMAMVYGLMDQMRGEVTVESRVGRGTVIRLHFPVASSEPAPDLVIVPHQPSAGGIESILLVEDDDAIRKLSARVLQRSGYEVTTAHDGESAASIICDRANSALGPFALIISDIVMPAGGGVRVFEAMTKCAPETRLLWMTGYSGADLQLSDLRAPSDAPLVQKPWTAGEFLASVRAVLDAPHFITVAHATHDVTRAT